MCLVLCVLCVCVCLCVYLVDTKTLQSQHNINKQNATKCGYQRDPMQHRDTETDREKLIERERERERGSEWVSNVCFSLLPMYLPTECHCAACVCMCICNCVLAFNNMSIWICNLEINMNGISTMAALKSSNNCNQHKNVEAKLHFWDYSKSNLLPFAVALIV